MWRHQKTISIIRRHANGISDGLSGINLKKGRQYQWRNWRKY